MCEPRVMFSVKWTVPVLCVCVHAITYNCREILLACRNIRNKSDSKFHKTSFFFCFFVPLLYTFLSFQ